MAQAITSNGQDVFANAETGYMAYKFWKERGVLPTEQKDLVGGGIKHGAMTKTFALINRLHLWYSEQQLFKKAGALKKASDSSDYLDAAVALAKRYADDRPQDSAPDNAIRIVLPKKAKKSVPAHVQ
jgi:hypothetical protein